MNTTPDEVPPEDTQTPIDRQPTRVSIYQAMAEAMASDSDTPPAGASGGLTDEALLAKCPGEIRDFVRAYPPTLWHVVLTSLLPVLASVTVNYFTRYPRDLGAHLYVFVVGDRGSGKGFVSDLRRIVAEVDDLRRGENVQLANEYERSLLDYEAAVKAYRKDPSNDLPEKPKPPPIRGLLIPGNASGAAIYKRMASNPDTGLICETEAGTTINAMESEHGGFRTDLCAAFHCETMSSARTTTESHHIESPHLSILFAGTPRALDKLLPDPEDGLASRFIVARVPFDPEFVDPTDDRLNAVRDGATEALRRRVTALYRSLSDRAENPARFALSAEQKASWLAYFKDAKRAVISTGDRERSGELHRNALVVVRVAMVLAAIRETPGEGTTHPTDADFEAAMELGRRWWIETCALLDRQASQGAGLNDQQQAFYEALPQSFTASEARALAKDQGVADTTARKWMRKWVADKEAGLLDKSAHGSYAKPGRD